MVSVDDVGGKGKFERKGKLRASENLGCVWPRWRGRGKTWVLGGSEVVSRGRQGVLLKKIVARIAREIAGDDRQRVKECT